MVSCPAAFSGSWSGAHSGERPPVSSVAASVGEPVSLGSSVGEVSDVLSSEAVPLLSSCGAHAKVGTRTRVRTGSRRRPRRKRMNEIVGLMRVRAP